MCKIQTKISDSYHLIDVFETLNAKGIPDNTILVSFDIVNMFPTIDNNRGVAAVKSALHSRTNLSPSTESIIEALEICLTKNNSAFADPNLIQTNGTAMVAANSFSYSNLAIQLIGNAVIDSQGTIFQVIIYFGLYNNKTGDVDKIELLTEFLISLDKNLKFTVEIGGQSLCFLDLKITVDDKKLLASAYSKPTNSHLYLDSTSCHPTKSIDWISTGVAERLE